MERTVTIRDGRVGGEGRDGLELAVIGPDGSLALPPHVLDALPPGTLVRLEAVPEATGSGPAGTWRLTRHDLEEDA